MQRRTFLGGVGVLAAAAGAAFGTGAISNLAAERRITVSVAGDGSAYLRIRRGEANGFAVENLDGAFRLSFRHHPNGGDGLNEGSVSSFDDAFRIVNTGSTSLRVRVEDASDEIEFYVGELAEHDNFVNDRTVTETLESGADPLRVGVRIDLRGATAADAFAGGDGFTILAEAGETDD